MVKISIKSFSQVDLTNKLLVVGLYENNNSDLDYLNKIPLGDLPKKINDLVNTASDVTVPETLKKFGKNLMFLYKDNNDDKYLKVLLLGLGKINELNSSRIRQLGGIISLKAKELSSPGIVVTNFCEPTVDNVESLVEGLSLSLYEFSKYKSNGEKGV